MKSTLVLNASFEPLNTVSYRRAFSLILKGEVDIVEDSPYVEHSANGAMSVPYVIRYKEQKKIPYRATLKWSKRKVFIRDNFSCVYCGNKATTIDHVHPQSKGGGNSFSNCVASCVKCNSKKGSKSLEELGWVLPRMPKTPSPYLLMFHRAIANPIAKEIWKPYINAWTGEKSSELSN